jgi:hypothetical protein
MSHPWKLASFKKQIKKSHYYHQYAWVWYSCLLVFKNNLWK